MDCIQLNIVTSTQLSFQYILNIYTYYCPRIIQPTILLVALQPTSSEARYTLQKQIFHLKVFSFFDGSTRENAFDSVRKSSQS